MASEPWYKRNARRLVRQGEACSECLGLGWVRSGEFPVGHPRFGQLERCPSCGTAILPAYLRKVSGLTGWLHSATFDGYLETNLRGRALEEIKQLHARGYGWLTLWGQYGAGKTYLLAALVNESVSARRPAVYATASQLLDHLRDAYAPEGAGYSAAFVHWSSCQVLALDEVDVLCETPWAREKYRTLLDHRYNLACGGDSVTVFASNHEPGGDGWPEWLEWLTSRMGQFTIMQTAGGDIRSQVGKAEGTK